MATLQNVNPRGSGVYYDASFDIASIGAKSLPG